MTTADQAVSIHVYPWPTEKLLTWIVGFFSFCVWVALCVSLIGILYAALFGLFFFITHVIFISHVRGNGVRVGPDQLPDLYAAVDRLAKKIGFEKMPEIYLLQAGGILNALATKFLKSQMIILYSDLIDACGNNQAAQDMIIAHELGHLKQGHLRWHWFLMPGFLIPFLGSALSRAREFTCDRYGLAGAGDRKAGLLGLAILAAGAEKGPKVNLQAMARQVHDLNTGWMTLGSWLSSHPPLTKRIIALEQGLRPENYVASRGPLRALGILGAVYVLPLLAMIGVVAGIGIAQFVQKSSAVSDSILPKETPNQQAAQPTEDVRYDEEGVAE